MNVLEKPDNKPNNPNFSSGPCAKRPGWDVNNLTSASVGRSHRSKPCKSKIQEVCNLSRSILKLPDDYHVALFLGLIQEPLKWQCGVCWARGLLIFCLGRVLERDG